MINRHNFYVGIFYYMLGNIRPRYRSSLKCIQLLCVLKASYIQKLGINVVLQPFMEELKLLEQVGSNKLLITNCTTIATVHICVGWWCFVENQWRGTCISWYSNGCHCRPPSKPIARWL